MTTFIGRGADRSTSPPATHVDGFADGRRLRLSLLGGFHLAADSTSVPVSPVGQRVLACLALNDRRQARSALAGRLWPDVGEDRAAARLRTALWRLPTPNGLLEVDPHQAVALGPDVVVDVDAVLALARRSVDRTDGLDDGVLSILTSAGELLPDWDDEWVALDRERIRQVRFHALERLAEWLAAEGRLGRAVEIAMALVADDPLRESACRTLIRIHATEGNVHDAIEEYERYRRVMREELGLRPSPQMEALMAELGVARSARGRRRRDAAVTRRNGHGDGNVTGA